MAEKHRNCLHIGLERVEKKANGCYCATARVGGREVYFESAAPLAKAGEAFLTAFLFPAMCRGLDLEVDGPVCPQWLENIDRARALAREWWGFSGGNIWRRGEERLTPAPGQALLFGGGVDSFYTLHQEKHRLSHLIYVEGFDVDLSDTARLERVRGWNRAVAESCGLELVVVRTNIRHHPDFKVLSWTNSCGGALAAVGHLLRDSCGTVLLANDGHVTEIDPWAIGIHPRLTPGWASGAVHFIHHAESPIAGTHRRHPRRGGQHVLVL
mgnify:CR=1 FL=1